MERPHRPQRTKPCSNAQPSRKGPLNILLGAIHLLVTMYSRLILFVLRPGDIAFMMIAQQHGPFMLRQGYLPDSQRTRIVTIQLTHALATTEYVCARID